MKKSCGSYRWFDVHRPAVNNTVCQQCISTLFVNNVFQHCLSTLFLVIRTLDLLLHGSPPFKSRKCLKVNPIKLSFIEDISKIDTGRMMGRRRKLPLKKGLVSIFLKKFTQNLVWDAPLVWNSGANELGILVYLSFRLRSHNIASKCCRGKKTSPTPLNWRRSLLFNGMLF